MKRGNAVIEPWSTKEKLCLSSAVLRSGDQNWMSVSRVLRVFGEQDRPSEWYSQKQCALQYEALLNNVGTTKRKKRSEKGVETNETPSESIVRKLLQERLEEVNRLIEEDRRAYIRLKKEIEDIESGRADDRLDEFEREIEEEKEREATRGSILRQHEERSRLEGGRVTPHLDSQPESKVPTSPLLTSLLQSPSGFRSSSIHSLINPSPLPSHSRANDSPTLSRLLESPAKQMEPTVLFPSPVKKEPVDEDTNLVLQPDPPAEMLSSSEIIEEVVGNEPLLEEFKEEIAEEKEEDTTVQLVTEAETELTDLHMQEVEVEIAEEGDKSITSAIVEPEEQEGEKDEQEQSSLVNLQDSDTMEEQHSMTELDSQTVNMIVAGGGVISVSHDTSSEHLEEVTLNDIQHKEDSEAAESLDGTSDTGEMKEAVAGMEVDSFIIGSETPKDNYVVQLLCSTPDNSVDDEAKTPEVKDVQKTVAEAVLEVGGEMVSLGGAEVVEEEVDTTVHEVEVLVSELDTTTDQSMDPLSHIKPATVSSMSTESEVSTSEVSPAPCKVENENEVKQEENLPKEISSSISQTTSKTSSESRPASPLAVEEEEVGKRPSKKRLISGSACSDSKPNSPAPQILEDSKEYRSWKKSIMLVYNRLATHKYASMFLKPITNEQAPAYDTVVHRPVDLFTIKKRIEAGELRTTVEFQRDLLLMFQNAIMYNNSQSLVYEMASIMQKECLQHIELMVDAMGEGVPWGKDVVNIDKLHTRARGEAPKRKRTSMEEPKPNFVPKRRRDNST